MRSSLKVRPGGKSGTGVAAKHFDTKLNTLYDNIEDILGNNSMLTLPEQLVHPYMTDKSIPLFAWVRTYYI